MLYLVLSKLSKFRGLVVKLVSFFAFYEELLVSLFLVSSKMLALYGAALRINEVCVSIYVST